MQSTSFGTVSKESEDFGGYLSGLTLAMAELAGNYAHTHTPKRRILAKRILIDSNRFRMHQEKPFGRDELPLKRSAHSNSAWQGSSRL